MSASPRALVIAGLDPSGGAGIVLDAFVLARLGYTASTVATVLTAQNSADFFRATPVSPDMLAEQIEAVLTEGPVACVKVGAVGSSENARLLASLLPGFGSPVVVDPVLASSSGGNLTGEEGVGSLSALCAAATIATPNAEEATRLAGSEAAPDGVAAARMAGAALSRRWGATVVVTGVPSSSGAEAIDVLCTAEGAIECLAHPLVPRVGDVRGTGCMFSSALAAGLGRGLAPAEAVRSAQSAVAEFLAYAAPLGAGCMQIDFGRMMG